MTDTNTMAPSYAPHAELRKTWREGQRWQTRGGPTGQWLDTVPCWYPDQEYRRHPDDFDAAAPTQAGEYPELPPLQVRYDGLGHTTTMGYGVSQMRDYADATCAARGAALAALKHPKKDFSEVDSLLSWFNEKEGFSQGTRAPHKWVLQTHAELIRLRAALAAQKEAND